MLPDSDTPETTNQEQARSSRPDPTIPAIQNVVFSVTTDGTIQNVNTTFADSYNSTPESFKGRNIFEHLISAGLHEQAAQRKRLFDLAVSSQRQVSFIDEQFGKIWRHTIYPFVNEDEVSHLIVTVEDITNIIETANSLASTRNSFDFMLHSLHLGSWSMDLQNGKVSSNREQNLIFGYPENTDWTYERFIHHIIPEDRKRVEQLINERLADHKEWSFEYRIQRADGTVRWLQDIGGCELDANRKPVRLIGILRDITDIKASEIKLGDLERQWDSTAQDCRIGMWKIDLQTRRLTRSRQHAAIYEEDIETTPTWTIPDIIAHVHTEDRDRVKSIIEKSLAEHTDYTFDARIYRSDGTVRWVHIIGVFQFDDMGKPISVLGTTQDVTEQIELAIRQEQLQVELQQSQKLQVLGQLAGGIAHDVNNVLAAIQGNTELVLNDMSPADPHYHHLVSITHSVNRSADMVKQLLAFARKQPMCPIEIEPDVELERMYLLISKLIRKNISLRWQLNCPHQFIKLDPACLVQIITNLFINACDAIEGNGIITLKSNIIDKKSCTKLKHVTADSADAYVRISITDTGSGIDPQTLPHIFEPFFTTKGIGKGTGLGLSTVYGLVKQNNGHITCQTTLGKGTMFDIFFPVVQKKPEHIETSEQQESPASSEAQAMILVVEDESDIITIIRMLLEREGFIILTAENAEDAIELARAHIDEIRLTISDILLPGMNGVQLSNELQKLNPKMKFMFMSGYSTETLDNFDMFSEDSNFISKPFSIDRFLTMVLSVLKTAE